MWIEAGVALMGSAAASFRPLVDALNHFAFVDAQGHAIPSRLIEGEGNPLWDQWTWPNTLVLEDKATLLWRGAAGTLTQFLGVDGSALLICGVRVLVSRDGLALICAANVCTKGDCSECEVQWKEVRVVPVGSALANSNLNELVAAVITEAPAAAERFTALVQKLASRGSTDVTPAAL
jgi:hypothetical protein